MCVHPSWEQQLAAGALPGPAWKSASSFPLLTCGTLLHSLRARGVPGGCPQHPVPAQGSPCVEGQTLRSRDARGASVSWEWHPMAVGGIPGG